MYPRKASRAFTLIELLIVIAIVAVLSVTIVLTLNPAELLKQSRDGTRLSDMDTINKAVNLTQVEGISLGTANTVYVSLPDSAATTTAGDQCQGLGLPTLPATYAYHCAASSTIQNVDGTGWIPVNFTQLSEGSPLSQLPQDPMNNSSSRLYYTYTTDGSHYETTAVMESAKYKLGGSNDWIGPDGGTLASVYEKGSKLNIEPLDYGDSSLVSYWTFDEGTGTVAYDYSGNNATGSWGGSGSPHYIAGKAGPWASNYDGTSDVVTINQSNPAPLNFGTGDFSMAFWLDPASLPLSGSYTRPFEFATGSNNSYFCFTVAGGVTYMSFLAQDSNSINNTVYSSSGVLSVGSWIYIVAVANRTSNLMTMYVNGSQSGASVPITLTGSVNPVGGTWSLGAWGVKRFNGTLDNVRIYNRVLSASEIKALYAGKK